MNKQEMEKYLRFALEDICRDYLKYNPAGEYLNMCIFIENDRIYFHANDCEEDHFSLTAEIGRDDL